ncbi:MAG: DNA polymerase ligase N-terminal domain-containing protein [Planctomycetota bacterium]
MLRFVLHRHTRRGVGHLDLMLEGPRKLRTWKISSPYSYKNKAILAKVMPDHRRIYLTYQGKVSRGRGNVRIVDAGSYRILGKGRSYLVTEFRGKKFKGQYLFAELPKINKKTWLIIKLTA